MHRAPRIIVLFFLISPFLFSCGGGGGGASSPQVVNSANRVQGVVYYEGAPLSGAVVTMDGDKLSSTTTSENGHFELSSVTQGAHMLTAMKQLTDGSFTERTTPLSVNGDLVGHEILLPKPIALYEITNVADLAVSLSWDASNAADFREYKVYRHTSPGLDETTGTLVYVATDRSTKAYVDTVPVPKTTYYYRVFVMNQFGRLGGSNIVSITTGAKNLVPNPSFEELGLDGKTPSAWNYDPSNHGPTDWTTIGIDTATAFVGSKSVVFEVNDASGGAKYWINTLGVGQVTSGSTYRLSFRIKASGNLRSSSAYIMLWSGAPSYYEAYATGIAGIHFDSSGKWTLIEKEIQIPASVTADNGWGITIYVQNGLANTGPYLYKVWIDDVHLE